MTELENARQIIEECDAVIASAFEKRMAAAQQIADYKIKNALPLTDSEREQYLIEKNCALINDPSIKPYYKKLLEKIFSLSKNRQKELINRQTDSVITVFAGETPYDIILCRGALESAGSIFDLDRKVLIVTDDGVPAQYANTVCNQCREGYVCTMPQGEGSKTIDTMKSLLSIMLEKGFSRKDCVVAVGGGVVGDIAGFTASAYMRGVDFYNIPTTVLSQVDSSIGGKTAVNINGIKNIAGAFYQPRRVLIDTDTLATLPQRQVSNGLAEALKTAVIADRELFELFESGNIPENIDTIIRKSLLFKKAVVEQDEKETGLRKILNFGHTIGHGIESVTDLYHGECVALGMIPMCSPAVRERLIPVLEKLNLPVKAEFDADAFAKAVIHDKKGSGGTVSAVLCENTGLCTIEEMSFEKVIALSQIVKK